MPFEHDHKSKWALARPAALAAWVAISCALPAAHGAVVSGDVWSTIWQTGPSTNSWNGGISGIDIDAWGRVAFADRKVYIADNRDWASLSPSGGTSTSNLQWGGVSLTDTFIRVGAGAFGTATWIQAANAVGASQWVGLNTTAFGTEAPIIDFNKSNQGVALMPSFYGYNSLIRIDAAGQITLLANSGVGGNNSNYFGPLAPRIIANGDIYAFKDGAVMKWAAESTSPTTAYAPSSGLLRSFDVRSDGTIIVAEATAGGKDAIRVLQPGGIATTILTSETNQQYSYVRISRGDHIAASLESAAGPSVLFGMFDSANPANSSFETILTAGATPAGASVPFAYMGKMELNDMGQLAMYYYNLSSPPTNVVLRFSPDGTSTDNPDPGEECGSSRCFPLPTNGFYDPDFASGYSYEATGNAFSSVLIPFAYGDGLFDLFLWDVTLAEYVDSGFDVTTGEEFSFITRLGSSQGVARFQLRGIEQAAKVDPNDPYGFITGLDFIVQGSGSFRMTPIVEGQNATVPEPGTLALLCVGLSGLLTSKRRKLAAE